ncbi:MAG: lipopolysaccharide transport periplasmic protein LptA [Deltaproteobacteria bacterium]|nr:lipopolysaccharide transport periplasmic protein LptA [Deltaproteobacteria bacterium]
MKKPVTVISDTMDADRKQRVVVFRGNVYAKEDFDLCGDVLTVYYDEADETKEIVAAGNVRIVQGDKRARGEKAVYDREKKAVVITGKPSAMQCADVVDGEKITFHLDSDRMIVEGRTGERVKATINPKKECSEGPEREEFKCGAAR